MAVARYAAGRRWVGLPVIFAVAGAILVASISEIGGESGGSAGQIRLVRSSNHQPSRVLALSTSSLHAGSDPWRGYLAGEAVCPGGERTDLPVLLQVSTVACLVNFARSRRGLAPLVVRSTLSTASLAKAKAIGRCQNFAHNPCGGDWTSAVRSTGFVGPFGENLYLASGRWGAPRMAVDSWLNSPSHRENLFAQEWREQGIALLRVRLGSYGSVTVWVNTLARG